MTTTNTQLRAVTALAVGVFLATGAAHAEPVGFLAVAEGQVELQPSGASTFAAAALDQEVEIGDTLRTGRDSLAKVVLVDDTILTVDEETELRIDQYVVGPAATGEPSRIELLGGHVRTKVGEAFGGPTRLEMHTPTAVIGVKGTEWLTWYLRQTEQTIVCVVSGTVAVENPAVGGSYEPPLGDCAEVLPHLRPRPVEFPASLNAVKAVSSAAAPPPPAPPVATGPGPGVGTIDVSGLGDTGDPPIEDSLDAAFVEDESEDMLQDMADDPVPAPTDPIVIVPIEP